MADLKYRQDSAPKGGYPEIQFKRIILNRGPSSWMIIVGGITVITLGLCAVNYTRNEDRCNWFNIIYGPLLAFLL